MSRRKEIIDRLSRLLIMFPGLGAKTINDTIEYLEGEEAIRPTEKGDLIFCGWCRYCMSKMYRYCPMCGREVKRK